MNYRQGFPIAGPIKSKNRDRNVYSQCDKFIYEQKQNWKLIRDGFPFMCPCWTWGYRHVSIVFQLNWRCKDFTKLLATPLLNQSCYLYEKSRKLVERGCETPPFNQFSGVLIPGGNLGYLSKLVSEIFGSGDMTYIMVGTF